MNSILYCTLSDGRKLAYSEYGDCKGKPVLYFHGWPGSRLGAAIFDDPARKLGLRIISPDRPGFGKSDYQEHRRILDWPNDVTTLLKHLRLRRVSILGVSGGGPYALACSNKIPKLLESVGIVGGLGPITGILYTLLPLRIQIAFILSSRYPMILDLFLRIWSWAQQHEFAMFTSFMRLFISSKDREAFKTTKLERYLNESTRESFRLGVHAAIQEAVLYGKDWEFNLNYITTRISIFHGKHDGHVPLVMSQYISENINTSRLTVFSDDGHFPYMKHMDEILGIFLE